MIQYPNYVFSQRAIYLFFFQMKAQQINLNDTSNRKALFRYIGQAKQLIEEQSRKLSTLYKQPWQYQQQFQNTNTQRVKNNQTAIKHINLPYEKLRYQTQDLNKFLQTNKRNTKLIKLSQENVLNQQLIQVEKKDFGSLVYDRFPGKKNNIWKLTFNSQGNYQYQPFLLNIKEKMSIFDSPKKIDDFQKKIKRDFQFTFDSKFQSGNLTKVFKQSDGVYNLLLQNDTNTLGYTHWFYFSVKNLMPLQHIKINIVNLLRGYTLFHKGMKVLIHSQQKYLKEHVDWHRGGSSINYFQNGTKDSNSNAFYTLYFQYTFEYANDTVKFALNFPYTYSELRKQLLQLTKNGALVRKIGLTVLKNQVYMIQIKQALKKKQTKRKKQIQVFSPKKNLFRTQQKYQTINENQESKSLSKKKTARQDRVSVDIDNNKPVIIIMARVHPCQSNSSLIMSGILQHLFGNNSESKYLLKKFSFKMFPMINPDGVIHGNSRVSLTGADLNRRWKNPDIKLHPQIYAIKKIFQGLKQEGKEIFTVIDLHGHAKNQNAFLYGCCEPSNYLDHANIRLFNAILGKIDQNFDRNKTSFFVSESKNGTARVVCSRQFSKYSYTMETSFLGKFGNLYHFSVVDYFNLGRNILKSLAFFCDYVQPDPINIFSEIHVNSMSLDIKEMSETIKKDIKSQKLKYKYGSYSQNDEKSDGGSSSNPSLYNLPQQQIRQNILLDNAFYVKQKRLSLQSKKGITKKSLRGKSLASITQKLDSKDSFEFKNIDDILKPEIDSQNIYECFNFKTRKLLNRSKKIMFQKFGEKLMFSKNQAD